MADVKVPDYTAAASANKVSQPTGTVSNAPPTPPETQEGLPTKPPSDPISDKESVATAPVTAPPPFAASEATVTKPSVAPDAVNGVQATPTVAPPSEHSEKSAEVPANTSTALQAGSADEASGPIAIPDATDGPASKVQEQLTEAERLASQPEKPSDNAPNSADAQPVNTVAPEPADAVKKSPKPVSVEEIQDAEMPTISSKPSNPVESKLDDSKASEGASAPPPQDIPAQEAAGTDASSAAAKPAKTEAQSGEKRKADEVVNSTGEALDEAVVAEKPAEKKQKTGDETATLAEDTKKKPGRPKKEKKAPAPIGRTARKTRSQGAAE
ncbi:hypothetical protein BX600DRAFT_197352 [Xylariales sp. PMI_506]|nr:hypothetical protein BX600DRAFT_197352 [Xylariales sp. PMI_506]